MATLNRQHHQLTCGLLVFLILCLARTPAAAQTDALTPTRYLAFQMFTSAPSFNQQVGGGEPQPLSPPPPKAAIKQFVQNIVDQVGETGDAAHKLAFFVGPLAFDHTDAQLVQMVRDSFQVAVELNIAVGFHIDDSMFWVRRSDLWRDPKNVEWRDWEGTLNTGRRIDWSTQPTKLAPQMCFNSTIIQAEVARLASQVIGTAIEQEVSKLVAQGHPELFAGVIVGWETQIGQDFDTNQYLGYCALTNRGFSRANPPADLDVERERAVGQFITLWATGIQTAGIDPAKIYAHTAVTTKMAFDARNASGLSYTQINHFAPPEVTFGANFNPGFSTYPEKGLLPQLYDTLQKHGNPRWASSEGAIVMPATSQNGVTPETYLAWMFNHNAGLVNLYGWGVGTLNENPFWKAAASPDAIAAYRKFLRGQPLIENPKGSDS